MNIKKSIQQWKQYGKISDLVEIARRKFFNNYFDGALTCAGIVSGVFIIFLAGSSGFAPKDVLITCFATALAIGISGLWGAFLSEEAERKKKKLDIKKEMAIIEEESKIENIKSKNGKKKEKPLLEKAEKFATIIASLVDGGAPVLGSSLPLILFFFGLNHLFISYSLILYLSSYLFT